MVLSEVETEKMYKKRNWDFVVTSGKCRVGAVSCSCVDDAINVEKVEKGVWMLRKQRA